MAQQKTEIEARTEFLEQIEHKIKLYEVSKEWEIKTKQKKCLYDINF